MAQGTMTNEEKIVATINPRTAAGNPASVDGPVRAENISGDGSVGANLTPLSIELVSGTQFGTPAEPFFLEFDLVADADLGQGVREIRERVSLEIVSPEATILGASLGTPLPK